MNTFTKGPWRIDTERSKSTILPNDSNHPVAETSYLAYKNFRRSTKEVIANANLIAAAPELLEACEYVVKYHREHDSGEGELFGMDFVTTCIAAIAKAKGDQP